MNPYILERPKFNLVDAFSRGREQGQNYRMNQQNLAENDYKIAESKRLQQENEKIKQIFGGLLKQSGGNIEKAQKVAVTEFPEYAQVLSRGFAQLRGDMPDPIKQQQDQLNLQTDKNELIVKYGAPLAQEFLNRPPGEQLEGFRDFANQLNQAGIPILPEWVDNGYTPEAVGQIQSLAASGGGQQSKSLPANLQIYEAVKNMSPEERLLYMETVRSPQWLDMGTNRFNPLTGERYAKDAPIQDQPFFKELQASASERGKLQTQIELEPQLEQAKTNMSKIVGAQKVVNVVNTLRDKYDNLRKLGGIVDLENSTLENILASTSQSSVGQAFQSIVGSDAQSIRNEIKTLRTWGLLAIKDAAQLGTTSMNTAAEMKIFLDLATKPEGDYQSNIESLKMFEKTYGEVLQTAPGTHKNNMDGFDDFDAFVANYKSRKTLQTAPGTYKNNVEEPKTIKMVRDPKTGKLVRQ